MKIINFTVYLTEMIGSSLKRQPIGPKEGFTLTNVEMYEVFLIFSLIFAVMATMFYLYC